MKSEKKIYEKFLNFVIDELKLDEYMDMVNIKTIDHNVYHKEIIIYLEVIGSDEYIGIIRLDIYFDRWHL